jgi:hypothetical protein
MLRRHRPDEDPQGFQTTHEAYRIALQWARQQQPWATDEAEAAVGAAGDPLDSGAADAAPATPESEREQAPAAEFPTAVSLRPPAASVEDSLPAPAPGPATSAEAIDIEAPAVDQDLVDHDADDGAADWTPDPLSRTQRVPVLEVEAPQLRCLLADPAARLDPTALQGELDALRASLSPEDRLSLAYRIAAVVEASPQPPAPGVVSVLAEALDWDARFLRQRGGRIDELLAADEVCAAIRARLQDPAPANRALRALAEPPRWWHPRSWPLWGSTRATDREVAQIEAEGGAMALRLLDPQALRLSCALADRGDIGRHRIARWLVFALAVALGSFLLLWLLQRPPATAGESAQIAFGMGAWTLAAAYVRARVLQVYALPLEPARPLWLMALLLGLLLLAGSTPEAWFTPIFWLVGVATATVIGRARLWPGVLALGASLMLPAALHPLISPLPDAWLIANLVLLSGGVLMIDHVRAHRSERPLAEVATEQQPLFWLGGAIFMLLAVVGAVGEEARQPLPVRPTHVA